MKNVKHICISLNLALLSLSLSLPVLVSQSLSFITDSIIQLYCLRYLISHSHLLVTSPCITHFLPNLNCFPVNHFIHQPLSICQVKKFCQKVLCLPAPILILWDYNGNGIVVIVQPDDPIHQRSGPVHVFCMS